jgi:pyrroloquinoline quinone biosynthesis protein E
VIAATDRPGLPRGVRLVHDPVRDRSALLYPEGALLVNETATAVLRHCDGRTRVASIVCRLEREYRGFRSADAHGLLDDLATRRLVVLDGTGRAAGTPATGPDLPPARAPQPMGMLAELTYRCPLHCAYCANPTNLNDYRTELATAVWLRLLHQARALGVLQVHLSGGEPLLRRDLPELVREARSLGMYTNLVTSGISAAEPTLESLAAAGLDHVQLSIQDSDAAGADAIAGRGVHRRKLAVAAVVTGLGLPLTVNVVLHRRNVDHLMEIADLAAELGAGRLELAHTQFYGWAWRNRAALLPTREQVDRANTAARRARERYGDRLEFVHVEADYYATTPNPTALAGRAKTMALAGRAKPCMNGWGSRQFVVAPNGDVLPCLAAGQLPDLPTVNACDHSLDWIWHDSPTFNRFRGTAWLPEPCQGCAFKEVDFGGCRCQAYQITGDPSVTDPACSLSPMHHLMVELATASVGAVATPRRAR